MNNIILLIILTLCWGFQPFFKKKPLQKISSIEFYCIEYLFYLIPISFYFIYLYNKNNLICFSKVDRKDILYFIIVVTTGTIGGITFAELLKKNNATYVIPSVQPLIIAFSLVLGYFLFKEKIDIYQFIGTIFVVLGIILINLKKFFN
jgi:uncharacterized membrane protein